MSSVRSALLESAELHLPRRGFLGLLTGAMVTPAIIKVAPLMRIKPQPLTLVMWGESKPRMMWYIEDGWWINKARLDIDLPPLVETDVWPWGIDVRLI